MSEKVKIVPYEEEIAELKERLVFWEKTAKGYESQTNYYRVQLSHAHALLGRVIHQLSHRWDSVRLNEYFPTANLHGKRTFNNPEG